MKHYAPRNLVTSIARLQTVFPVSLDFPFKMHIRKQNKSDGCPLVHKMMQLLKDTDWIDLLKVDSFSETDRHTHTHTHKPFYLGSADFLFLLS